MVAARRCRPSSPAVPIWGFRPAREACSAPLRRARLLLADGVGLSKTIQVGLVITELIARRLAHRVLVVSPPGPLLEQWQAIPAHVGAGPRPDPPVRPSQPSTGAIGGKCTHFALDHFLNLIAKWQWAFPQTLQGSATEDGRQHMFLNCATAQDVLKSMKDNNVRMVDLRFADLPGTWQHFSVPPSALNEDAMEEGIGFDGSSIRGFQEIQESDMLVVPDPTTAFLDPFTTETTLAMICNIRDPLTGESYSRDPRYIAQKAEAHLKRVGVA